MQPLLFDNKQFRIKEESQRLLIRSLNEYVLLFVVFLIKIIVDSFCYSNNRRSDGGGK
jgi:hypothetical protein